MTDITITLGNRPELDAEERKLRALRAQEVLAGAGWAFDEVITGLAKDLLGTDPSDTTKRETLYHQIDAAAQLKGHLSRIIQAQQAEETANVRKYRSELAANHE